MVRAAHSFDRELDAEDQPTTPKLANLKPGAVPPGNDESHLEEHPESRLESYSDNSLGAHASPASGAALLTAHSHLSPDIDWEANRKKARQWLALGVGSLLLSGLLAVFLALARMPLLDRLIHDPLFFRRGLVVHVDLALLVWVYALVAALYFLLPAKEGLFSAFSTRLSAPLGATGVLLLLLAAGARGSEPILANYVPVIDHPLFLVGLVAFAGGVLLALLNPRLLPGAELVRGLVEIPAASRVGLRASALAVILALLTFAASWLSVPSFLDPTPYFENLFWGGGHVLQVASVAAMMAVWLMLLESWSGAEILSRNAALVLFGALLLPILGAPLLAMQGPSSHWYRTGFTRLMQWGIFPVVSVVLVLCIRAIVLAKPSNHVSKAGSKADSRTIFKTDSRAVSVTDSRAISKADPKEDSISHTSTRPHTSTSASPSLSLRDGRVLGFFTSAGLTVLGFILGAMIRGSNTMVPAHYHAAIGAVTASLMAVTFLILPALGVAIRSPRLSAWQPVVFGVGQAVFALGFGIAGWFGMDRKVYGSEQLHRTLPESIGLAVMGSGGILAAVGGVLFLTLVMRAFFKAEKKQPISRMNPEREASEESALQPAKAPL